MSLGKRSAGAYAVILLLIGITGPLAGTGASGAEMSEMETFIRARIEIGESMADYMRQRQGMERSMENYDRMTDEINAMVDAILEGYGLTAEEYQARSPKVFSDKAAVEDFLKARPDLKKRYSGLSLHQPQ